MRDLATVKYIGASTVRDIRFPEGRIVVDTRESRTKEVSVALAMRLADLDDFEVLILPEPPPAEEELEGETGSAGQEAAVSQDTDEYSDEGEPIP